MKKRWVSILLFFLVILLGYELVNQPEALLMFLVGNGVLVFRKSLFNRRSQFGLFIGMTLIMLAFLRLTMTWVVLVIGGVLLFSSNVSFFSDLRQLLFSKEKTQESEFIAVRFEEAVGSPLRRRKSHWWGEDARGLHSIYEWEDVHLSKLGGETFIDLGNTVLPKADNLVVVNQLTGRLRILVPQGVAYSVSVSGLLGELTVAEQSVSFKNETVHWRSDGFEEASRRLKVVATMGVGEVEVIIL